MLKAEIRGKDSIIRITGTTHKITDCGIYKISIKYILYKQKIEKKPRKIFN